MSHKCTIDVELKNMEELILAAQGAGATDIRYGGTYHGENVVIQCVIPDLGHFGVVDKEGKMVIVADRDNKSQANAAVKDLAVRLKRAYAEELLVRTLDAYGFQKDYGHSSESTSVFERKEGQEFAALQQNEDGTMTFIVRKVPQPECEQIAKHVSDALGIILNEAPLPTEAPGGVALPLPLKKEREASKKISAELLKIVNIKSPIEQRKTLNRLYKDLTFEYGTRIANKLVLGKTLKKIAEVTLGSEVTKVASIFEKKSVLKFGG